MTAGARLDLEPRRDVRTDLRRLLRELRSAPISDAGEDLGGARVETCAVACKRTVVVEERVAPCAVAHAECLDGFLEPLELHERRAHVRGRLTDAQLRRDPKLDECLLVPAVPEVAGAVDEMLLAAGPGGQQERARERGEPVQRDPPVMASAGVDRASSSRRAFLSCGRSRRIVAVPARVHPGPAHRGRAAAHPRLIAVLWMRVARLPRSVRCRSRIWAARSASSCRARATCSCATCADAWFCSGRCSESVARSRSASRTAA